MTCLFKFTLRVLANPVINLRDVNTFKMPLVVVVLSWILLFGLCFGVVNAEELTTSGAYKPETNVDSAPVELSYQRPSRYEYKVVLPKTSSIEEERVQANTRRGPRKVGVHRDLPLRYAGDLSTKLTWKKDGDGVVAYLSIRSPAAHTVRFSANLKLPSGATLVFYEIDAQGDPSVIHSIAVDKKGLDESEFWSPAAMGESIGVEVRLPKPDLKERVELELLKVAHRFDLLLTSAVFALACSNHEDIQCAIEDGEISEDSAGSTMLLEFESEGLSYVCTGTILNVEDGEDVFIPYVITSAHCISTSSEAASIIAYWKYQSASCDSDDLDSDFRTTYGGADLLATRQNYDQTLVRLRNDPPAGTFYLGWWATDVESGEEGFAASHPDGGFKKFFSGVTSGNTNINVCGDDDDCFLLLDSIEMDVDVGAIEGGSSGSGLRIVYPNDGFDRFVGVLSAADEKCVNGTAYFGEFRHFYPAVETWFNPDPDSLVDDDHGDYKTTATVIRLQSTTDGEIDDAEDIDYFKVEVDRVGTIEVYTSGSLDTTGQFSNEDDTIDVLDDDSGSSLNFSITLDVRPGIYYIKVEGYSNETGDYTLHVEFEEHDDHGDTEDLATVISSSARNWEYSTNSYIDEENDKDVFELVFVRQTTITIYTEGSTDTAGRLTNSNGVDVLANDDTSEDDLNFLLASTVDKGTYYLYVTGDVSNKSEYKLRVLADSD